MKFNQLSGVVVEGSQIKSVGDVIVIDGLKHTVDEVNTYHEEWDGSDVHKFTYTLKAAEAIALTQEELDAMKKL